jgi:diguanylate cyclase (GGDEF)-like protein/putative nucleotidyltransferase with HDIG domain
LNRKVFYETISEQMSQQQGRPLALVNLNVDDFKLYNQLYGNKEGDLALQRIAGILAASAEGRGTAFRLTGKEFALLLPEYDAYSAKCLAQSVLEQVRKMHVSSELGNLKMLTMSCGVCAAPYMASTAQELTSGADFAVYTAKRRGKNKVVVYSEVVESERQQQEEKGGSYDTYASTIYALTAAIDTKDHYTFQHSQNVANYASTLAIACGMDQQFADVAKEAGLLHDIGKIGIPEDILNKPGKLTQEEYEVMKTHVENSVGIIRHLPSLDYVIPAVLSHHERYDGAGYPRGIAGEDIPLMGRILCIVDSFDAMVSKRSYKKAMSVERALEIIRTEAGKQFDPKLAEIFIALVSGGGLSMPQRDEETVS